MRLSGLLLALQGLLVAGTVLAQSSKPVEDALRAASAQGTLYDDGVQPWHLKLAVTLAKPDGSLESGTVEQWHNGRANWRIVYDLPSYRGSRARQDRAHFSTAGMGEMPFALRYVDEAELTILPTPRQLEGVELQKIETGLSAQFTCLAVRRAGASAEERAVDARPTYCFDKSMRLDVTMQYRSLVTVRNQVGTFLGRTMPTQLTVTADGKPFASAKVIALQARSQPFPEASVTDGMDKTVEAEPATGSQQVAGGVIAGVLLKKVQPRYPESAKSQRVSGPVWLHALISKEGKIEELTVITSPSKDLSDAAMEAVRDWTYRPYLLNGKPTEVDTTITVNFTLGNR